MEGIFLKKMSKGHVHGPSSISSIESCPKKEHQTKPDNHSGEDVFNMVKDVQVVFGKVPSSQPVPNDANRLAPMWNKKSIFWELPY